MWWTLIMGKAAAKVLWAAMRFYLHFWEFRSSMKQLNDNECKLMPRTRRLARGSARKITWLSCREYLSQIVALYVAFSDISLASIQKVWSFTRQTCADLNTCDFSTNLILDFSKFSIFLILATANKCGKKLLRPENNWFFLQPLSGFFTFLLFVGENWYKI